MKPLFALAVIAASSAQGATLPNPNWPNPADRGELLLQRTVLSAHNTARHLFGVAPLAWSAELAAEAQQHAQYMASTGIYGHDRTPGRRKKIGRKFVARAARSFFLRRHGRGNGRRSAAFSRPAPSRTTARPAHGMMLLTIRRSSGRRRRPSAARSHRARPPTISSAAIRRPEIRMASCSRQAASHCASPASRARRLASGMPRPGG